MTEKPQHPDHLDEVDEVADAIFARIMSGSDDEEVARLARAFTVALAVNDPERPDVAPPPEPDGSVAVAERPGTAQPGEVRQGDDDVLAAADQDGDVLRFDYGEKMCPHHKEWEPFLIIHVNEEAHLFPVQLIPQLVGWLNSRFEKARSLMEGDS